MKRLGFVLVSFFLVALIIYSMNDGFDSKAEDMQEKENVQSKILRSEAEDTSTYPTSGADAKGNTWVYNKETKTLTFSGNKDLEDCTDYGERKNEPAWWDWWKDAEHIVVEEGVTGLGGQNFGGFCNVTSIQLPQSCTKIGVSTFAMCCSLESITLPSNLKSIGDGAFDDCTNLKSIQFPEGITSIGSFAHCENLVELIIPDSVKTLPQNAFVECKNLTTLKLPASLKKLEREMFRNCEKLTSISLPQSLTTINERAFQGAYFETIVIPKNVCKIEGNNMSPYCGLFKNCHGLKTIIIKSKKLTKNKIFRYAFKKTASDVVIKVPKSKLKEYRKIFRKKGLSKKVKIKKIS